MTHSSNHPQFLHHPHALRNNIPRANGREETRGDDALISLRDFCFAYDQRPVLSHVDLQIDAGESVVLMGDNGSGKSTLLKALSGLVFAQLGSYRFDGAEVSRAAMADKAFAKRLHQRIGFVFQDSDAQLFCARVEDEIAFGPRQMQLPEEQVEQRVSDVCSLLEIRELRDRAPYNLSGGEKKKVAIACALAMNPDVYCFDEPMAGLDRHTREWLLKCLTNLKTAGKTLVIATHDQSLADSIADWFAYMGDFHGYEDRPHVHINI